MTRGPGIGSRVRSSFGSWPRAALAAVLFLVLLSLAIAGQRGQSFARREAALLDLLLCREHLQQELDQARSDAAGTAPRRGAAEPSPASPGALAWSGKLRSSLKDFSAAHGVALGLESASLRLCSATLAVAERRLPEALSILDGPVEPEAAGRPGDAGREADFLRLRADVLYDRKDWAAALESYRKALQQRPEDLSAMERTAECLVALQQPEPASQVYSDLARRLQERGSQRLARLDSAGAVQDLNKAATLRIWLLEHGRRDAAPELAQSFSSCAKALLDTHQLEPARAYLEQAINLYTELVTKERKSDLLRDLAGVHAQYAGVLAQSRQLKEALPHLGRALEVQGQLVEQGRLDVKPELAASLARRGSLLEALGQKAAATQDLERAAELHFELGNLKLAASCQDRALQLAEGEQRKAAEQRLERYRAATPNPAPGSAR